MEKEIKIDEGIHTHLAYFGSELACSICNPNCYKKHGCGLPLWCGDEDCPSNPKNFEETKEEAMRKLLKPKEI